MFSSKKLEQKTGFEPATLALARRCSTTEPLLHNGGGGRIRTFEVTDSGFTVRPLWPLGNPTRYGANNGTRTRNLLITSQLLYQLSYVGIFYFNNVSEALSNIKLATWKGLEPSTSGVTGRRSNQLNYQAT